MRLTNALSVFIIFSLSVFCLVTASGIAIAQQDLLISFGDLPGNAGPPKVTVLEDGTTIFRINVEQGIEGDVNGTLSEEITQVCPNPNCEGSLPITTLWTIKTSRGLIKGYYSGQFVHLKDLSHRITQYGRVLLVSGAYVNLHKAEIFYNGTLDASHMAGKGTISIVP